VDDRALLVKDWAFLAEGICCNTDPKMRKKIVRVPGLSCEKTSRTRVVPKELL